MLPPAVKTVAIIPALGGSKGIPRKNVRPLGGLPLIAHTIGHARRATLVDRVVVSTDDVEISAASVEAGAEVVARPAELAADHAPPEASLLHVLAHLRQTDDYSPDLVVFLQCTSPLTSADDIDGTVQALLDRNADTALAVTPFHYFLWQADEYGDAVGINDDRRVRLLTQQREPQYRETGAVYVMRARGFLQAGHRLFGRTAMYVMPPERCLEIDEAVDFQIADVLMRRQFQQRRLKECPDKIAALVLDFDGVFTDNKVLVDENGREAVTCDRSDGLGVARLKQAGLLMLVLSTEKNPVVEVRCQKLGIACIHGVENKLGVLRDWCEEQKIDPSKVVYLGNDLNDVACMQAVGCGVAVGDACPQAKAAAKIVLRARGGRGAIRELSELIELRLKDASDGAQR